MTPTAITKTATTPTSLTARIQELVSACFTGIWLETCEPEEACREISSLCQTQSWRLASWDCDVGLKIHGHDLSTQHDNPAPKLVETLADTTDPLAVIRSAGQLSQGADTTPPCGGDIRLIVMRPQLCRLPAGAVSLRTGGPREARPSPTSANRSNRRQSRPPTDWGELVQAHDDRNVFQATDRRAARDRYPQPLTRTEREASTKPSGARTRRDSAPTPEKRHFRGKSGFPGAGFGARETGARGSRVSHQSAHACGSAIGRAIQYPPTPTPTSAPPTMRASACESSRAFGLGWPSKRTIRPI